MDKEKCIDVCNELLRGEIAAVETYEQAIEKVKDGARVSSLSQIRSDHQRSVKELRENIIGMGGTPSTDSGVWGTFAKAVEGGAKMFGESAALSALKEGEKHGVEKYREALNDEDVMLDCKNLIREKLLPRQQSHLSALEAFASRA